MAKLIDIQFDDIKDEIIDRYASILSSNNISYFPNPNDDEHLIAEAFAYRLNLLLQSFNHEFSNIFLQNATDKHLTMIAKNFFAVDRLKGSKPTAKVIFTLSNEREQDTEFRKDFKLNSTDGQFAILQYSVIIKAGETKGSGILELQENVKTSNAKTTIPDEILAFPYTVTVEEFTGGDIIEDDVSLKERCLNSLHIPSTAGSKASYEYHVKSTDSRIEQVNIYTKEKEDCKVFIRFYTSQNIDDDNKKALLTKVKDVLNNHYVRPLGVLIDVDFAREKRYIIDATITLPAEADTALYEKQIMDIGRRELDSLRKIGKGITQYQILNIIGIDNDIKEAELTVTVGGQKVTVEGQRVTVGGQKVSNIECLEDEIAILVELGVKNAK